MSKKLCRIDDLVKVKVIPNGRTQRGPIAPMYMDDSTIHAILSSRPAPPHFYALDPNDQTRKVKLTKENYKKTTEELFYSKEVKPVNNVTIDTTSVKVSVNDTPSVSYVAESNEDKKVDNAVTESSTDENTTPVVVSEEDAVSEIESNEDKVDGTTTNSEKDESIEIPAESVSVSIDTNKQNKNKNKRR